MIDAIKTVGGMSLTNSLDALSGTAAAAGQSLLGGTAGAVSSGSFAEVLGGMAKDAAASLRTAETRSFEGIRGEANIREVVDAVMAAEQSLQTAIAIRDKVVSAYLEIARMPI